MSNFATLARANGVTTPARYQGSLAQFHGPVMVGLDPAGTLRHGEPRFLALTPEGEILRQVRLQSLDFNLDFGRQARIGQVEIDAVYALEAQYAS